ncbi:Exoglucanase 1 [Ceratocystis platani]|uniref:Glucanase n=1 Tax=Ceratocystis fimbriata f. sp. platani TaxID=88771 RepID=A0A0F8DLJ0_CERFI|nr:Exoglucanase 1 [Ceratocystis platani]
MYGQKLSVLATLVATVRAQQACSLTAETHPSMNWQQCTTAGCDTVKGGITVDANWRWTHEVSSSTNCYTGNTWSSTCTNGTTCAEKCCVDGADYSGTYGATTTDESLSLSFVTKGAYSTNVGSRMYMMADENKYQMFQLLGKEFTFDVDVSNLGCGLNGALYFVSMDEDGGMSKYPGNKAGAKYGTGYCDSQCPRDIKFIGGVANSDEWTPSSTDANAGIGGMGSCCSEMDIWEANKMATAYTPHPCNTIGQKTCQGDACGGTYSGQRYGDNCDPDGCDFNSYRMGDTEFFGAGKKIDSTKKVTVVTQFIKSSDGKLADIKRFYVQDGVTFENSESKISGVSGNSINEEFCSAQKKAFGDKDSFTSSGGLAQMGAALEQGMVLVMSLWDDNYASMLWLDSTYPVDSTAAGSARGECSTSSGKPSDIRASDANSKVIFSNIKFGDIGTTFTAPSGSTSPSTDNSGSSSSAASSSYQAAATAPSSAPSSSKVAAAAVTPEAVTPAAPVNQKASTPAGSASTPASNPASGSASDAIPRYGKCGGGDYSGSSNCVQGTTCKVMNPYYSQCI